MSKAVRRSSTMQEVPHDARAMEPAVVVEEEGPKEEVFRNEDLMKLVFSHLCLEDLCKAGIARRRWHEVTCDPTFWRVIDLEGRPLKVNKVCWLLKKHTGVYTLRARRVRFQTGDLPDVLPHLTSLRNLELEKGGYDERDLEALSRLPALTRLLLAGGFIGNNSHQGAGHGWANPPLQAQELFSLSHPGLLHLTLEGGRAGRLAISAPKLVSLEVRDFSWQQVQLQGATSLAAISMLECGKLADSALRSLLCLEGQHAQQLPSLARLHISGAAHLSDETLRLAGQRHHSLASVHVEGCGAVTGANLAPVGAYPSLQHLWLEGCDLLNGGMLAASVQSLPGLESLTVMLCPQMSALALQSSHLTRLCLQGNRGLQELSLRCPRLSHVDLSPPAPGMASSHVLRRISLSSYAVERLTWAAFPALEEVKLQCSNLLELDLSECTLLKDSVFDSLGPGAAVAGFASDISPGCPRLRVLKLSDCDSLCKAALSSPSLESLQLSHCARLQLVRLDCPGLARLGLEECTALESVDLATQRMASMSLGTCPRLEAISIRSPTMDSLDLRGCNSLTHLRLDCPGLRKVDATFCGSLPDSAMAAVAQCPALEELTLAVCNSLTADGLVALSALQHLQSLDLSYMPIEDPRPIYAACRQLTSLTISNNYLLNPAYLRDLLPRGAGAAAGGVGEAEEGGGSGSGGGAVVAAAGCSRSGPIASLVDLDVSYCEVPPDVLEDLIVRGGRQLTQLTVSGCSGVTDALLLRLHRRGGPSAGSVMPPVAATALRVLSMMGSKALRHVYLGLMPPALAAAQGFEGRPRGPGLAALGGPASSCRDSEAGPAAEAGAEAGEGEEEEYVGVGTALPSLEELRIGLTGVRTVAIGLPSLTRLQLFNCSELRNLALDCPRLEKLSVQACKRLGVESLVAVLRSGCPSLQELDVQYFSGVDASSVPALRAACPSLQAVYVTAPQRR